jgi:hypothetical protein
MSGVVERLNALALTRVPALDRQLYAEAVRPRVAEAIALPARPGG